MQEMIVMSTHETTKSLFFSLFHSALLKQVMSHRVSEMKWNSWAKTEGIHHMQI